MKDIFYKKNIKALKKANKPLYDKIIETKNKEAKFHTIRGKDPLDIDILDIKREASIYISPLNETENAIRKIESESPLHPLLYFYGLGNSILYKVLLNNPKHQHIYVFESEYGIIIEALNSVDLEKEIYDRKLIIVDANTFNYAMAYSIFMDKKFKIFAKLFTLNPLSDYYLSHHFKMMSSINTLMARAIKQMVYSLGNDAKDSLVGIDNHLANLKEMVNNYKFLELVNKPHTSSAIIVSTGPSLDKQIPLLKEIQDYVCIISPDASLPHLEKNGIHADIVTSLERTEIVVSILSKTSKEYQKDKIYLLASVLNENAIKEVHGYKCIVMRPFGYTFYFDKLKAWGYHGIGMSVSNMAHELAYIMKFKNVALIGQDLSYGKNNESHSSGNVYGSTQKKLVANYKEIPAYGGEGVVKSYDGWILFKNYFESTIEETKDIMTTFNCTEGGARINGSVELPFVDFIKKYIDKTKVKEKITLTLPEKKESKDAFEYAIYMMEKWIKYGTKSKKRIDDLYEKVCIAFDLIEKAENEKNDDIINYNQLTELSDEIDSIKELFQNETFSKLFYDVTQSFIVHQELNLANIVVFNPKNEEEKKHKLKLWIVNHKYWLFSLSSGVQAVLETVEKHISNT
jgi:hypothetical protein